MLQNRIARVTTDVSTLERKLESIDYEKKPNEE